MQAAALGGTAGIMKAVTTRQAQVVPQRQEQQQNSLRGGAATPAPASEAGNGNDK